MQSDWDIAFIDGEQVPGIVKCVPKTSRKVDVANAPGLDAATLRLQGVDPGSFSLSIVVWTRLHLSQLEALLGKIAPVAGRTKYTSGRYQTTPTGGKTPRPASFTFYHPAAAAAGIGIIIVEDVEWFAEGPVKQSKMVTLGCKQALPPKKVFSGNPKVDAANAASVTRDHPSDSQAKRGS